MSGVGRSGRGAFLQETLNKVTEIRRPGEGTTEPAVNPVPVIGGRGAQLAALASVGGRGAQLAAAASVGGRGAQLAAAASVGGRGAQLAAATSIGGRGSQLPTEGIGGRGSQLQSVGIGGRGSQLQSAGIGGRGFESRADPVTPGDVPRDSSAVQAEAVSRPAGRGFQLKQQTEAALPQVPMGRGAALQAAASLGRGAALQAARAEVSDVTKSPEPVQPGRTSVVPSAAPSEDSSSSVGRSTALSEVSSITSALKSTHISPQPVTYRGSDGMGVRAKTNYMKLEIEKDRGIFVYDVRFNPVLDSHKLKYSCLRQIENVIGKTRTFDGTVLYLPFLLPEQVMTFSCKNENDDSPIKVVVKYQKTSSLSECVHFYNVLFKKIFNKLNLVRFGKNFYSPDMKHGVAKHKLEVWPGYIAAVEEYEGGLFLNCDVSHRVLRTETVYEIMKDIMRSHPGDWKKQVTNEILGFSVLTRYNNSVYRIDDIDFDLNPRSTFPYSDGTEMSYLQYYKQQYQITIEDHGQPMLIHKKKKRDYQKGPEEQLICLVPELCYSTGLSEAQKGNFTLMKDISNFTKPTPVKRQLAYETYLRNVKSNDQAISILNAWGLKLPDSTIQADMRLLPSETIFFGNNMREQGSYQADWNRAVTNKPVLCSIDLANWCIIFTMRDKGNVGTFIEHMLKSTRQMGINVSQPFTHQIRDDRTETYIDKLREVISPKLQIVVIIFPSLRSDRYAAVKKICCVEQPIASQVINGKTISRPDKARSIVQKIALQMNCKMGGSLWTVHIPCSPNSKIMICGMDSYHDALQKGNSVSAFVASMNNELTRWYSKVAIQHKGQELIDELKIMFTSSLKKFHAVNGKFPDRIMIYRDGVGDGQLQVVRDYEIKQLESVFKLIAPDYSPKFTFIVVQKRINTRIFLQKGRDYDNPNPGTVLDHTVTRKFYKDFFLVSQFVRQGTVSPTHFIILYDSESSNLKPDLAQKISYKLCHLYFNWPGTVRVPAPCQYAHKLAYLIGQSVKKPHSDFLDDKLFYL